MIAVLADVFAQVPHRERVREVMLIAQQASRAEPGCVSYVFAETLEEPGHFVLHELWSDREALDRHFRGPALAAYREAITPLLIRASEVRIFSVQEQARAVGASPTDPRTDG